VIRTRASVFGVLSPIEFIWGGKEQEVFRERPVVASKADLRNVEISERDRAILAAHLPRFGLTTYEVLRRLFWAGHQLSAVKKWVQRMHEGDYIAKANLGPPRAIFIYLTKKAIREFNLIPRLARPIPVQEIPRAYGILSFCCLGTSRYRKLTAAEFEQRFPALVSKHFEQDFYYVDHDYAADGHTPCNRLGYIYVDSGKRVRDILRRYESVVAQRFKHGPWNELLSSGRFVYSIVTPSQNNRERLLRQFPKRAYGHPLRIEVRTDLLTVTQNRNLHASQRTDNS
jgi:hypothetical protein